MEAIAEAHPNIALVKYWGKRDGPENVPATPSLSITLSNLRTRTRVAVDAAASSATASSATASSASATRHDITLNGARVDDPKIAACADRLIARSGSRVALRIDTDNNFPTAAGLASSASGFAALVTAIDAALGLRLTDAERSLEARRASASAARSLYGGYVALSGGDDPASWIARPELDATAWPLTVVVAICSDTPKAVSSSVGMARSRTSPYYDRWLETAAADFVVARAAVAARDFDRLADVAEANCLAMHAVMLSARPGLLYWTGATVACIERIHQLRASGERVFFTIDAGPQVKAVCAPDSAERVHTELSRVAGVREVLVAGLGGPARVISSDT
jgi:diphosphomevalonate decarboxylase